ncbi:Nephrocystin-3 [Ceratocystis fimbriata CBS 114723]|uniref:Nephrocystin-3 n=1 Tax=Ceratocystis fimbriata CBS 114723 TaxID=1035309 RepID=A0A2C5WRF0_9PEZI|nr:Nephrocystin-3 [Ceratocystis fimbriata CBS 114723]
MSSATQPHENAQPFKILSLDDGDVGGLSSLLILENIMENIQNAEGLADTPKPCDRFDLIGGTGTGGIIAILLGRLAIRENCPLTECVEERKAGKSTTDTCQHEDQKLTDQQCVKTVVLATTKVNIDGLPMLFKTYQTTASWSECKAWEVGRATSAMVGLFRPIKLGRDEETFMNSSFGYSNPCKVLINEANKLSDHQEMLILSIGTGLGEVIEISHRKSLITRALKKVATSSKKVAAELEKEYSDKKERYYRFDTANSQGAILASNRLEPSGVAAHSQNYIKEKQHDIQSFAQVLINGFPLVSEKQEVAQKLQELQQPQPPQQPKKSDSDVFTDPVAVYHIPFHENLGFVGRQDVLSELDNRLFTHTGFQQVALVGLGGMGKTQVALKFAYTVKEKYTDCSVFWVTAATIDGFRNSCKELAAALGIDEFDCEDPRILVKNYLDANVCGKWLLVLDNVDDASLFDALAKEDRIGTFLPQSDEGRIMFTTRSKSVSWLAVKTDSLELKEMSSEELTTILMRSMEVHNDQSYIHDEHSINELLDELCHLPLAVAQAADYMAINQIPVAEYLELLRDSNEENVQLLNYSHIDDIRIDNSHGAVATTWLITFQQIQKSSPDAVNLLRFIANVEPKAIPQTMLPGFDKKKSLVDAIGILLEYGFIRRRKGPGMFDMHSLVHWITQVWCNGLRNKKEQRLDVLNHMTSIFPQDDWENRFLWRQYLPHALRVIEIEKASERSIPMLAFKVSQCLQQDGNILASVKLLEYVCKMEGEALAADHPSHLMSQEVLAGAYLEDGQTEKAVSMLEHVVMTKQEILAADHPSRLASQNALARAYLEDGQTEKAVSMLEHVVMTKQEALAADHPSLLMSQEVLAGAYIEDGQTEKAVSMLEHVVMTKQEILAADHPSRLASQNALARAYHAGGQIEKAVALLERVVEVDHKAPAAVHPDRLASQHQLAKEHYAYSQSQVTIELLRTLYDRYHGKPSRSDIVPKSRKLSDLEEQVIVEYIINLGSRGFPPRLRGVEEMANRLLADRDASPVGKRWASNFIKRQPDLKTCFNRRYDYERAKCEDPVLIRDWFRLVESTIANLLESEVQDLRQANEILSKRRRAKRTRLQDRGRMTLGEGGIIESSGFGKLGSSEGKAMWKMWYRWP